MTIRKEKIDAALSRLAEQFPKTFVTEKHMPHRPLKVGIAADIQAALPDLDRRALGVALKVYTHRIVYLQAVVVGADRVDLDGNPAGQVTASEAEYAAAVLAGIMAQRVAKRSAAAAPAKLAPAPISAPPSAPPLRRQGRG
jgi:ProP effector